MPIIQISYKAEDAAKDWDIDGYCNNELIKIKERKKEKKKRKEEEDDHNKDDKL